MANFLKFLGVVAALSAAQTCYAGIIVVDAPSTVAYTVFDGGFTSVQFSGPSATASDSYSAATASASSTADTVTVSASSQSSAKESQSSAGGYALTQAYAQGVLYFHVTTEADFNLTETNTTVVQSLGALQLNSYAVLFQGGVQIAKLQSVENGSVSLQGTLLPGYQYALRRDSGTNAAASGSGSISGTAVLTATTPPPPGPSYIVPEPSTCVLLALGGLGLMVSSRRRK